MTPVIKKLYKNHLKKEFNAREFLLFNKVEHLIITYEQAFITTDLTREELKWLNSIQNRSITEFFTYLTKRLPKSNKVFTIGIMALCVFFLKLTNGLKDE